MVAFVAPACAVLETWILWNVYRSKLTRETQRDEVKAGHILFLPESFVYAYE